MKKSNVAMLFAVSCAMLAGCGESGPKSIESYSKNLPDAIKKYEQCELRAKAAIMAGDGKTMEAVLSDMDCENAGSAIKQERSRINELVKTKQEALMQQYAALGSDEIKSKRESCEKVEVTDIQSVLIEQEGRPEIDECKALHSAFDISRKREIEELLAKAEKEHAERVKSISGLQDSEFMSKWASCNGDAILKDWPYINGLERPSKPAKHNERYWGSVPETYSECHAYYENGLKRMAKLPWRERDAQEKDYCKKNENNDKSFCDALKHVGFEMTMNHGVRMSQDKKYLESSIARCKNELAKEKDAFKRASMNTVHITDKELCKAAKDYRSYSLDHYKEPVI